MVSNVIAALLLIVAVIAANVSAHCQIQAGIGLGYDLPFWQNSKQSDVVFRGEGLGASLWFEKRDTSSRWFVDGGLSILQMHDPTENVESSGTHWNVRGGYTVAAFTPGLFIGGTLAAADKYDLNSEALENNAPYFLVTSDLYASARYEWPLDDHFLFIGELDLALFSGVNEADSWGFNQNQKAIEDGRFSMQDAASNEEAFALENWRWMPIWEQFTCRTNIEARYNNRLALAYTWELHSIPIVEGYPTVIGAHRFILKYYFLSI